jgi:NADPH:quinone reductase-like Zn-dependent oxidoreductase
MLIRLPEDFAFENAAQFGVSTFTTAQMFWESQKLARINLDGPPSEFESITLLIWGGASATGHYAIQYAKLAGYKIIVTASPKHFDRIRALGADVLFDYNDPEVVKKIREATGNKLKYAADCISEEYTLEKVSEALGEGGGVISCILPCTKELRKGVTAVFSNAFNLLGEVRCGSSRFHDDILIFTLISTSHSPCQFQETRRQRTKNSVHGLRLLPRSF